MDTASGSSDTTYYLDDVEYVLNSQGQALYKRFIGSHPIQEVVGSTDTLRYIHTDHLGSMDAITSSTGVVQEKLSFSAFGERRKSNGWQGNLSSLELDNITEITNRGFTGHEHVDHAKIIHMNGRIYDAVVGRFLQPDPIIQEVKNSQNYNRYSYVLNNPLSYTDPTGYTHEKLQDEKDQEKKNSELMKGEKSKKGNFDGDDGQKQNLKSNESTNQSVKVDFNGDPEPEIGPARRSTLPIKLFEQKLTGSINWACSGTSAECTAAITYMNELTKSNPDILNVTHQLTKGESDASIRFTNGYALKDKKALGAWKEGKNEMVISRMHNSPALERVVKHELGHAYGFPYQKNYTKSFMSYHNMGLSNISSANNYPYKFDSVSKQHIRFRNKPEPSGFWSLFQ